MPRSPYAKGPGDYGLAEMYDDEMRGPSQAVTDAEAEAEWNDTVDQARDDWDRERGLLTDDDDE